MPDYELLIYEVSYFSGKMQAYLQYAQLEHRVRELKWTELALDVVQQAGVMEVPLLRCPNGDLLRDSTRMIEELEAQAREKTPRLCPADPALAFVHALVEDYADEGLWRPALYYRWAFDEDARHYARRFAREFLQFPLVRSVGPLRRAQERLIISRQREVYLKGEGVTDANAPAIEQHYRDELQDLEGLLAKRPFLTGARPSLVDFGYFASMFRHFSLDPTPRAIMQTHAPAVYAWVQRVWAARADVLAHEALLDWDTLTQETALRSILKRMGRLYLPYLLANAKAVHAGDASFDVELDGHRYPGLSAIPFRAWSRVRLQQLHAKLNDDARERVDALLGATGCLRSLLAEPQLQHRYPQGDALPHCQPRARSRWARAKLLWTGTPHHLEG